MLRNTVSSVANVYIERELGWISLLSDKCRMTFYLGVYQIPQTEMFVTTPGINPAACFGSRILKKGKMQLSTEYHPTTMIDSLLRKRVISPSYYCTMGQLSELEF